MTCIIENKCFRFGIRPILAQTNILSASRIKKNAEKLLTNVIKA